MAATSMSASTLKQRLAEDSGLCLIDVRTPAEYQHVHVRQAENVPLQTLQPERWKGATQPVHVLCQSGARAMKACEQLLKAGVPVVHIEGGTNACVEAGLDVVRGRKAMSLERQVRIAAGSLVLIGVALAWWVHPAFVFLSGFIGAGLVFAGVTDTCGMGMMLARMPWNQLTSTSHSGGTCPAGSNQPLSS
jgi:rhodanese-related sulfurtransferase